MDSPFLTLSPGDLSQLTILPSVMVDDRAGMNTSFTAFRTCTERLPRAGARRAWLLNARLAPVFDATLIVPDCAILFTAYRLQGCKQNVHIPWVPTTLMRTDASDQAGTTQADAKLGPAPFPQLGQLHLIQPRLPQLLTLSLLSFPHLIALRQVFATLGSLPKNYGTLCNKSKKILSISRIFGAARRLS